MTDAEIKDIFARFQNLNLRVLIEDLERGLVAKKEWIGNFLGGMILCPAAHGWRRHRLSCESHEKLSCDSIGIDESTRRDFVLSWDDGSITHRQLSRILRSIWSERLADAEAVQRVLAEEGAMVR